MKLRQQLLILLFSVGSVGLIAFVLVLTLADQQLFEEVVPENHSLRDVESRSALLLQNYFRFMLTPDLISVDELEASVILIRKSLGEYSDLVAGQQRKQQLVEYIGESIDRLEQSGKELIFARQRFKRIDQKRRILEVEIEAAFQQYEDEVSVDIGRAIEDQDWDRFSRKYLPELRMIKSLRQQYLQLVLEIREVQGDPTVDTRAEIAALKQRIKQSSTMLEIHQVNSVDRGPISSRILVIYQKILDAVDQFNDARKEAEFALSKAEQSGIDLNQVVSEAITGSETVGWMDLRESLLLSGGILLLTLVVSYLLIYAGLDRMLRPLEKLQVVITRLGKGDFKQRSRDVGRTDEIGQLADAFNSMAEQLEQSDEQKREFIDQLEQKNMELERFTYTVSHELKSPLVTINGFLGLLQKDMAAGNQEKVDEDMEKISGAIGTMSRQLEDLLELSRVGRAVNPPSSFSFTSLSHEVVQMMQGLIDGHGAEVGIQDDMPRIYADQARIREVIKNLVENGIKFASAERHPRIEITAESLQDDVLCRVRDNGPGIEPRYQDKVFGLFDRLATTVPGTGVGLALVKRIVETHDGNIWIESQGDGQGCCFCFTLPIQRGS